MKKISLIILLFSSLMGKEVCFTDENGNEKKFQKDELCYTIQNTKKVVWNNKNKKWEKVVKIYNFEKNYKEVNQYRIYFVSKTDINDKFYNEYSFIRENCNYICDNLKSTFVLSKTQHDLALQLAGIKENIQDDKYSNSYTLRNVIARRIEDIH